MDSVITANAEAISVACNDPHTQLRTGCFKSTRNRGGTPMDGMHAISIHIIREPAAAADSGYNDNVFFRNANTGHDLLDLRKNGVVTTTRAPAHFLVG